MFEIYTMVSEMHDNVDLVLGVKNFVESEGEISMREPTFKFLNRAVIFSSMQKNDKTQRKKICKSWGSLLRWSIWLRYNYIIGISDVWYSDHEIKIWEK